MPRSPVSVSGNNPLSMDQQRLQPGGWLAQGQGQSPRTMFSSSSVWSASANLGTVVQQQSNASFNHHPPKISYTSGVNLGNPMTSNTDSKAKPPMVLARPEESDSRNSDGGMRLPPTIAGGQDGNEGNQNYSFDTNSSVFLRVSYHLYGESILEIQLPF